jgi:hypothetical protein
MVDPIAISGFHPSFDQNEEIFRAVAASKVEILEIRPSGECSIINGILFI